jgi:hypothetical protein
MDMPQEKLKPLADENVKVIQRESELFSAQHAFLSSRGRTFWLSGSVSRSSAYLPDQLFAVLASFGETVHERGADDALVAHGGGRAFLADPDTLERA